MTKKREYTITNGNGSTFWEVMGYPLTLEDFPDLQLFGHREPADGLWRVSEATTGLIVADADKKRDSLQTVLDKAERILSAKGGPEAAKRYIARAFRREETPLTGVVQINNTNLALGNEWDDGINIDYLAAVEDHEKTCDDPACGANDHEKWRDSIECDGSDTILLGSWKKDHEGHYVPDTDKGGHSTIMRESVAQVVWSETVTRVQSMCSPCYPNQADLDSGEVAPRGILCYTLPKEYFDV